MVRLKEPAMPQSTMPGGSACDFLTGIGQRNNLLTMRPNNHRLAHYPRVGLPLSTPDIFITAFVLSRAYG